MASRFSSSITIDRPIVDVFNVLTDVANSERWFPAEVREWWTSEPPVGVGSTRRAVVKVGWLRSQNDAVVTEYSPPRRAVMRGTSRNAPFQAALDFEPINGGTRVDTTIEFFLRGPAGLFAPVFLRWYPDRWNRGLATLKVLMESGEL